MMCYGVYRRIRKYTILSTNERIKPLIKWLKLSKDKKHYDWAVQYEAFFSIAYNTCNLIVSDEEESEFESNNLKYKLYEKNLFTVCPKDNQHPNYEIIPAIIYNLRHGIELALKSIGIINLGLFVNHHDYNKVFQDLKIMFNEETGQILNRLKNKIWQTIEKYGKGLIFNRSNTLQDTKNTGERYPEGSVYEIDELWISASITLIIEIKNDIKLLIREFDIASKQIWLKRMRKIDY